MNETNKPTSITNEFVRTEEKTHCLICGNQGDFLYQNLNDRNYFAPGIWNYKQCRKDDLIWLDPQPINDDIWKFYNNYCTHSANNNDRSSFPGFRKMICDGILNYKFGYKSTEMSIQKKVFGWIFSKMPYFQEIVGGMIMWLDHSWKGDLLDIGCGNGKLTSLVKAVGWNVIGIEPDPKAAKIAKEKYGITVKIGEVEDQQFPNNCFDVITMHHVIEHLPNPILTIKECFRILKPGGKLVIITPNFASMGSHQFKQDWMWLDPPRHMNLFTTHSLISILEKSGFEFSNSLTISRMASSVWIGSHLIHHEKMERGSLFAKRSLFLHLQGLIFLTYQYIIKYFYKHIGEELVCVAKK